MKEKLEEMYETIGELFPSSMELIKQLDDGQQALAYKSLAYQIDKTLEFSWDDVPACKARLELMRDQVKKEQYKLAQKI